LHPLACTAFNADFDGDQMAVHLPLGNAAILEAQLLMLGSHNILNPANGAPITVPSQDMVLGLYYSTKLRNNAKGEGMTFYSPEEVIIAYNEKVIDMHARIKLRLHNTTVRSLKDENNPSRGSVIYKTDAAKGNHIIETSVGRVLFNQVVPKEVGFINELLTKRTLRDIINLILKTTGVAQTVKFLDSIKDIGYDMAYKGGLSFNLDDVIVPEAKAQLIDNGYQKVETVTENYNMGLLANNERYNQIIDIWSTVNVRLTDILEKELKEDKEGFNPIYMMLDSGARGSKAQIRQLSGMRGLMNKPQKSGATSAEIIENPFWPTCKRDSLFWSISSLHTELVKVWQTRPLKRPTPVT